jgi:hypothetical protein
MLTLYLILYALIGIFFGRLSYLIFYSENEYDKSVQICSATIISFLWPMTILFLIFAAIIFLIIYIIDKTVINRPNVYRRIINMFSFIKNILFFIPDKTFKIIITIEDKILEKQIKKDK